MFATLQIRRKKASAKRRLGRRVRLAAAIVLAAVTIGTGMRMFTEHLEWKYGYDDAGRIVGISAPAGKTAISHEAGNDGRWKRHTKTTRPGGWFVSDGSSKEFSYDVIGNIVKAISPSGGSRNSYDWGDRLVTQDSAPVSHSPRTFRFSSTNVITESVENDVQSTGWRPPMAVDERSEETAYVWEEI
jgi:hypothetical protein